MLMQNVVIANIFFSLNMANFVHDHAMKYFINYITFEISIPFCSAFPTMYYDILLSHISSIFIVFKCYEISLAVIDSA